MEKRAVAPGSSHPGKSESGQSIALLVDALLGRRDRPTCHACDRPGTGSGTEHTRGRRRPARLCYIGHAKRENRNGLAVDGGITQASGTAEREAALAMLALLQPG